MRILFLIAVATLCGLVRAELYPMNPAVQAIAGAISVERITANLKKLESFGTRNVFSRQDDPARGIGAARRWIEAELRSYSPRLHVSEDSHRVRKHGRITRDVELTNIVAELPGAIDREREVIISAHYDTIALRSWSMPGERTLPGMRVRPAEPDAPAPGVNDDGSGAAAVMELARVMSRREFDKTLVFVLFTAEEEGLIGSTLYARSARQAKRQIEAVLNNDIIGSIESGDGHVNNTTVRVFSEGPADSGSRELARYIKDVGERYVPGMKVDLVFRADRFGRGGDHTPFNQEGFNAVRFTSAEEDYTHQHSATDTLANMSPPYVAQVARINAAVAAALALAPREPVVLSAPRVVFAGLIPFTPGSAAPAMVSRGKSRYDAHLRWTKAHAEPDLAGYVVLVRPTTAAFWQRRIFAGNVSEFVLPGMSIDEWVFGVQAVDKDGNASLAVGYEPSPRAPATIPTY